MALTGWKSWGNLFTNGVLGIQAFEDLGVQKQCTYMTEVLDLKGTTSFHKCGEACSWTDDRATLESVCCAASDAVVPPNTAVVINAWAQGDALKSAAQCPPGWKFQTFGGGNQCYLQSPSEPLAKVPACPA